MSARLLRGSALRPFGLQADDGSNLPPADVKDQMCVLYQIAPANCKCGEAMSALTSREVLRRRIPATDQGGSRLLLGR